MSNVELAKLRESCVKGHHVYRASFTVGAFFDCEQEPSNTRSSWAIVVKNPGSGEIVGHVPDNLAEVLSPILSSGEVQIMKCEVTGLSRAAAEGVWVQGGGIVIPCTYILMGKKLGKPSVREKLKKWARKKRSHDDFDDTEVKVPIKKEKVEDDKANH